MIEFHSAQACHFLQQKFSYFYSAGKFLLKMEVPNIYYWWKCLNGCLHQDWQRKKIIQFYKKHILRNFERKCDGNRLFLCKLFVSHKIVLLKLHSFFSRYVYPNSLKELQTCLEVLVSQLMFMK